MLFDVFISYSQKDRVYAEQVCTSLEAANVRCWIAPRNIKPGADWAESIIAALGSCRAMVVIFSSSANTSPQVTREVQRAFEKGLTVMPFRIEDVQPSAALEYYMGSVHWLDALKGPIEAHIEKLATLVKAFAESKADTAPATTPEQESRAGESPVTPQPPQAPPAAHAENEVASVIRESRKESAEDTDLPLRLSLQFNKAIVAGYSSTIAIRIENRSAAALENLDVTLESNALASGPCKAYTQVPPSYVTRDMLEIEAVKGGNFVLRCRVRFSQGGSLYNLRGTTQFTVNVVPGDQSLNINISDIQVARGARAAGAAPGGELAPVNISNLVPPGAIRTLNDLLNYSLPEDFSAIPLELDYEVSQAAVRRVDASGGKGRSIPKQFLGTVQTGTKLTLDPVETGSAALRGIRLVARSEFKLGRSRDEADFLTWFWPRSPDHDAMSRRLSRVHVIGKLEGGRILIRDAGSTNESTFEGHPLKSEQNDQIDQRGTLLLGHEYALDVTPCPSALPEGIHIDNIRLWSGPAGHEPVIRGCVRFIPTNSEIALYDALWLFTDANFGTSRLNPLVLELPGVAEVEGRFLYYRGNFWIEAFDGANIRIGAVPVRPREIVPITDAQPLVIGKTEFRVKIEA